MRRLLCQSMRNVSYHSKTLLHRNQAQARLCFVRLLCKNNKRNNKGFNICGYVCIILLNEHLLEAVVQRCSAKKVFLKISQNLQQKPCAFDLQVYSKRDSVIGV